MDGLEERTGTLDRPEGRSVVESEELLRLFVEQAPAALAMFDREMRYLAFSNRWATGYRLDPNGLLGRSHYEIFPEIPERWRVAHRRAMAGEVIRAEEDRFDRPAGALWLRWEVRPWRDVAGHVGGILIYSEDITGLKTAQEALSDREERLRLAVRASRVGFWDWNLQTNTVEFSSEWKAQLGHADHEITNAFEEWRDRVHADDLGPTLVQVRRSIEGLTDGHACEFRMRHKDGTWRWIYARAEVIRDGAGTAVRMLGCHVDVTDRKRAEAADVENLECQRAILASLEAHIAVLDRSGAITAVNPAWETFARENGGNLGDCGVGVNYLALCDAATGPDAEDAHRAAEGIRGVLEGRSSGFGLEYPCDSPQGPRRFILQATPLRAGGGGVVLSHIDITERMRAEEAIRDREARLAAILDTAADAIVTIDEFGNILTANAATERLFGHAVAEMVGRNVHMLMPEPYRRQHDGYLANHRATGVSRIIGIGREALGLRKNGEIFPIELAVSAASDNRRFTGIIRDATRRKELEREVVEVASREQRRIGRDLHDTVGQELTALNILASEIAGGLPPEPAPLGSLASSLARGLRRCQQQLRVVMRGLLPVPVDAEGLMAALADLADRTRTDARVDCAFDCPELVTVADNTTATQLYLIAQEAVHNAVKHARPRSIRISLSAREGLVLRVRDDGVGLPPEGESRGLGLRIMHNRAAIIGARLSVEAAVPNGTAVICELARQPHE